MKAYFVAALTLVVLTSFSNEYTEAIRLIKQQKYNVAETLLEAAQWDGDTPKIRYALGYCAEKQGRTKEAVEHYFSVIAINIDTYEHGKETENALKRLQGLVPEVFPVLNVAWEMQSKAQQSEGVSRAYLLAAAQNNFLFALDTQNLVRARERAQTQAADSCTTPKPMTVQELVGREHENDPHYQLAPTVQRLVNRSQQEKDLHSQLAPTVRGLVNRDRQKGQRQRDGRIKFEGHYYKVFNTPLPWHEAKRACEKLGGYLMTVETAEEDAFLRSLHRPRPVMLGAQRAGSRSGGEWRWLTGKRMIYENWCKAYGHPMAGRGLLTVRETGSSRGYNWITLEDSHYLAYICEWER
jgi:tetratricopeptide (TPR) repeat protein